MFQIFPISNSFVLKTHFLSNAQNRFLKIDITKNKFTYKDRAARLMILPTRAKRT